MMYIYILVFILAVVVLSETMQRFLGLGAAIQSYRSVITNAALTGFIIAPLWALASLWLAAHKMINNDTEISYNFLGFLAVFFGGMIYGSLTPKPVSRLKKTVVVLSWIIAVLLVLMSCMSAMFRFSRD